MVVKEGRAKACMQAMTAEVKRIARGDPLPSLPDLLLAGVDEAGRGALAGPVAAAAVILPERHRLDECRDSKTLAPLQRRRLARKIKRQALSWAFALANVREIAEKNILQAALLAMSRALRQLGRRPDAALVDGPHAPSVMMDCYAVVAGDARVKAISCASILAKVMRDELMCDLHSAYPQYGFAQNKGYGTARHLHALKQHGACPWHRKDFAPVRECIHSTSER